MQFIRFEDIKAWQESRVLVSMVFKQFKDLNDYDFRRQLFRAVLSIMNNIAEGYERRTNKEFAQFLFFPKAHAVKCVRCCMLHLIPILLMNFNLILSTIKQF
ncbi:four helix bundle protein [Candidatus Uhrbacteria bacterium]|nr:four helix bundle protein [Candidatus Uhrbacteria bacterium]